MVEVKVLADTGDRVSSKLRNESGFDHVNGLTS